MSLMAAWRDPFAGSVGTAMLPVFISQPEAGGYMFPLDAGPRINRARLASPAPPAPIDALRLLGGAAYCCLNTMLVIWPMVSQPA